MGVPTRFIPPLAAVHRRVIFRGEMAGYCHRRHLLAAGTLGFKLITSPPAARQRVQRIAAHCALGRPGKKGFARRAAAAREVMAGSPTQEPEICRGNDE